MLRIKVMLEKYGFTPGEELLDMTIANDATGTHEVGNYIVTATMGMRMRSFALKGHPREQGFLPLVLSAFLNLLLREEKDAGTKHPGLGSADHDDRAAPGDDLY